MSSFSGRDSTVICVFFALATTIFVLFSFSSLDFQGKVAELINSGQVTYAAARKAAPWSDTTPLRLIFSNFEIFQ